MQAHDEMSTVVMLFHQGTLFLKIHIGTATHYGSYFGAQGKFTRYQRTCIEDEIGMFQQFSATNGNQVGVTRTCTDNLDMPFLCAEVFLVDGEGSSEILSFHLWDNQFTVVTAKDSGSLTHTGCADMLGHHIAGSGNLHSGQFLSRVEGDFLVVILSQQLHKRFIGLHIDSTVTVGAGQDAFFGKGFVYLFVNLFLKVVIARPRPYADEASIYYPLWVMMGQHMESDFSFPSGHTNAAFAAMVPLFLLGDKKKSWLAIVFGVLMGISRIYLVVHFPSDVLGGLITGTLAGMIGTLIAINLPKKWYTWDLLPGRKKGDEEECLDSES